ncbi:MAG: GGDEF domain-containing protein, partial [Lachnospiraceae bacterium]
TLDCFSLVMLDLDRLKYVNDHFGHLSGDEYICTVVAIINEHTSDTDVLCRIGGDEFVIIFQNHPENFVLTKMKEIHSSVLQIKRNYPLSFSYGITHVSGGQYHSTEEILNLSDSRMYEFKNNHRLSNDIPVSLQLDEDETPTGK